MTLTSTLSYPTNSSFCQHEIGDLLCDTPDLHSMSPTKAQKAAAAKLDQYRRQDKEDMEEDGASEKTGGGERTASDPDKLLEAITFCRTSLTAQIEEVKMDISLIRQDFQKLRDRVKEAETRLSTVEDAIPPLLTSSDRVQRQIHQLLTKQDDRENRLRRCNIRLIGLPEGTEGKDTTTFLEQLLINTYGREAFSPMFALERAHRMPERHPPAGSSPSHVHS